MDTRQRIDLIVNVIGRGFDKARNAMSGLTKETEKLTKSEQKYSDAVDDSVESQEKEISLLNSRRNLRGQNVREIDREIAQRKRLVRGLREEQRQLGRNEGAWQSFVRNMRDSNRTGAQTERRLARLGRAILGLAIASVLIFMQSLVSALVALGGQAIAAAGSLAYAGRTIVGVFTAGIAQAIPMVGLLAAALQRLKIIQDAVSQADLVQKSASRQTSEAQEQQADSARQVADAQRGIIEAQENLTEARREARRELQDLMLAERRAALDMVDSRQALADAIRTGAVEDIPGAQLDVTEARLTAQRAREDAARARAGGVGGMPQVVDATRALDDATRSLSEAHQQAAESAADQSAAEGNLAFFLEQLTPAERRLYERMLAFRKRMQDSFTPITDHLINTMTFALGRVEKLLFDPQIFRGLDLLSQKMAESGRILVRLFTNRESRRFFVEMLGQARRNLTPLTKIAQNLFVIFRNIARGAGRTLSNLLGDIASKTKSWARNTRDIKRVSDSFREGARHLRAWGRTLENVLGLFGDLFGVASDSWLSTLDHFNSKITEGRENLEKNPEGARTFFEETSLAVGYLLDIIIALGDALIEAFDPEAVRALRDILRDGLIPGLQLGIELVGELAIAWDDFNDAFGGVPNKILGLAVALVVVKNTVGLLGTLFKGAFAPFIEFADWFGQRRGWFTEGSSRLTKIKESFKGLGRAIQSGFSRVREWVSTAFTAASEWAGAFRTRIRNSRLGQFVARQMIRARIWANTALTVAETFVSNLITNLRIRFRTKVLPFLRRWGGRFAFAIVAGLITFGLADTKTRNDLIDFGKELAKVIGIGIREGFEGILNWIIDRIEDILEKIPTPGPIPDIDSDLGDVNFGPQETPEGRAREAARRRTGITPGSRADRAVAGLITRGGLTGKLDTEEIRKLGEEYKKSAAAAKGYISQLQEIHDVSDRAGKKQRDYRKQLNATDEAHGNIRGGARKVGRALSNLVDTFFGTGKQSENLGQTIKDVTNSVLKAFGAKKLAYSIPKTAKIASSLISAIGWQTGGYMGMPWERGADDRLIAVAGGEAVLTGHHQAPVNMAMAYANQAGIVPYANLRDMFSRDKRKHMTAPEYQRGGMVKAPRRFPDAMGALSGLDALAWILNRNFGLRVISGLRPGAYTTSGNPSDHGWGGAIDVSNGVTTPAMDRAARWLANIGGFDFHPGVMSGGPIKQMLYRTMIGGNHFDHIHVALNEAIARNAGAVMRIFGQGIAGAAFQEIKRIKIRGPEGPLKDLLQGQSDRLRKEANIYLEKKGGVMGGRVSEKGVPIKAKYNKAELMSLWVGAGGPRNLANTAAAIALAESSGIRKAHNPSGATGLWQILGAVVPGNLYDPHINALNAVKKWKDAGGWSPWVVYTSGAYRRYLQQGGMVPQFNQGGIVPGPLGMPTMIQAHGGETVLPTHQTGGYVGRNLAEAFKSGKRTLKQARGAKDFEALFAKLDELTREEGFLDQITQGIEQLATVLAVGIQKITFKIRRGIVSRVLSFLQIANEELDVANEIYDNMERQGRLIRRAIRTTKRKLKKTKDKDRRGQLRGVLNDLNQRQDELEAAMTDQIQAIYDAQRAIYDAAIAEFEQRLNANDLIQQILTLQGELSGVIDQAALQANLQARGGLLQEQYNFIAGQLAQAQAVGDIELARELEIALLEAQLAILQNTQALQELNGTLGKEISFSSSAWTLFRQAILNTMGGLLPQYQAQIPSLQTGGRVVSSGLVRLHAGEVVTGPNAPVEQNYYFTEPMEVADPTVIGSKIAWEWKKNKI